MIERENIRKYIFLFLWLITNKDIREHNKQKANKKIPSSLLENTKENSESIKLVLIKLENNIFIIYTSYLYLS